MVSTTKNNDININNQTKDKKISKHWQDFFEKVTKSKGVDRKYVTERQ